MLGNNVHSDLLETKFNYPISKNLSQINPIKTYYNDCTFKLLIKDRSKLCSSGTHLTMNKFNK